MLAENRKLKSLVMSRLKPVSSLVLLLGKARLYHWVARQVVIDGSLTGRPQRSVCSPGQAKVI